MPLRYILYIAVASIRCHEVAFMLVQYIAVASVSQWATLLEDVKVFWHESDPSTSRVLLDLRIFSKLDWPQLNYYVSGYSQPHICCLAVKETTPGRQYQLSSFSSIVVQMNEDRYKVGVERKREKDSVFQLLLHELKFHEFQYSLARILTLFDCL